MKKKYNFKHNKTWLIIFSILTIILIIGVIVNAINLSKYINADLSLTFPISMMALLGAQFVILLLCMFNCHYTLNDNYFVLVFAVFFKRINYLNILLIREDTEHNLLLVYYKIMRKGEELIDYQAVNIKPSLFKDFVSELKSKNSNIVYENFDVYKSTEE